MKKGKERGKRNRIHEIIRFRHTLFYCALLYCASVITEFLFSQMECLWQPCCCTAPCRPASPVVSCPVLRLKKEPKHSDRDINGLLDRGSCTSERKALEQHPPWTADSGQDIVFATWGRRRLPFIGGIDIKLVNQLPGKPAAGAGSKCVGSY